MKQPRALWLWILGIAFALALVGVAFWLDPSVERWATENQTRRVREIAKAFNKWGDWPQHVIATLLMAGAARLWGSRKWTRIFMSMLIAWVVASAVMKPMQALIVRERPIVKIENKPLTWTRLHSFPSGHTTASTAFFATLAIANWRIGVPFLLIPIAIAFSRIYVSAHYLSDVVAGALIAVAASYFVLRFRERRANRGVPGSDQR